MKKVITYGTYDLLHEGHIRLLERAKKLGDYLIVGITADGFDLSRGKINVQQSLMERIDAVRNTGLADKIIIEEYEGQKIDDIIKYGIDVFTVGSDWIGKFDYLNEFCDVVYLDRTQGISSTAIRSSRKQIKIGLVGESMILKKFRDECRYVNGVKVSAVYSEYPNDLDEDLQELGRNISSYDELVESCDAVYIASLPEKHYGQCLKALSAGKHVICESPIALNVKAFDELTALAEKKGLVLMDGIKTAYSTAFRRLVLLLKGGVIGDVISVDTTCTSLIDLGNNGSQISPYTWNSICWWGPTAMLPIFDLFGVDCLSSQLTSKMLNGRKNFDLFTKGSFVFENGVASFKVGQGVKSEGEMVVSGTKGYIYVPAPWWKTDYFEVRYEDMNRNRRYFYQLDGEGIRYEILSFVKQIENDDIVGAINRSVSRKTIEVIDAFYARNYYLI